MNKRSYGLYAIALAIAVVGAMALGVPAGTLLFLAIALACPLMMVFMMRSMHGSDMQSSADRDKSPLHKNDHPAGSGRV